MKLYADEDAHELMRSLKAPIVVSSLARVEVAAAIWRKHRSGELDHEDAVILSRAFAADYAGTRDTPPRFVAVRLDGQILSAPPGLPARVGCVPTAQYSWHPRWRLAASTSAVRHSSRSTAT